MNGYAGSGLTTQQVAKLIDEKLAERRNFAKPPGENYKVTVNLVAPATGIGDANALVQRLVDAGLHGFEIDEVVIEPEGGWKR